MRVNFSVTNQLATPSIHAAALANRPPAGQPGRLFVDTDNPSSGIYRDTGTVWENITGGAGAGNLQTVTDAGNTTTNNILLNYDNSTQDNALVFYNVDAAQEEYLIEKRGIGITTNDSLVIQSRGNISPSTNPVGIMIDGANDVVKSFYTTAYTELGLKLDFANSEFNLGFNGQYFVSSPLNSSCHIGDFYNNLDNVVLTIQQAGQTIKTTYQGNDIGLKLDFANQRFYLGDYNYVGSGNGISFVLFDDTATSDYIIKSTFQGNDIGLNLDFANDSYVFGDPAKTRIQVNNNTGDSFIGDPDFVYEGVLLRVNSNTTTPKISTEYQNSEIGLKLDFSNIKYYLGDYNNINNGVYFLADNDNGFACIYQQGYLSFRADGAEVRIGDLSGTSNFTYFGVSDTNEELIGSTGLLSNTSGGSSGQHIKIRIGTTLYKIKLENP